MILCKVLKYLLCYSNKFDNYSNKKSDMIQSYYIKIDTTSNFDLFTEIVMFAKGNINKNLSTYLYNYLKWNWFEAFIAYSIKSILTKI